MSAGADGLLVVDKPSGCTSHDVVARCRRLLGQRRVGHGGTLDPDATGVLLVAAGQATRLLQFLSGLPKTYTGEVVLGTATSTLDGSGEVLGTWDMSGTGLDEARRAALELTGRVMQVPPMVSALKVGGRRLHELARAGIEVERAPRPVDVHRFEVALSTSEEPAVPGGGKGPVLAVTVECSAGTYVRSLAADLGTALGGGAYLRGLRRRAIGPFTEDTAVGLDRLEAEGPGRHLLPPASAVASLERVVASPATAEGVAHGRVLGVEVMRAGGALGPGPWAVVSEDGSLLAVYQEHRPGQAKPVVVLAPATCR